MAITGHFTLQPTRVLRVYCPVSPETMQHLRAGDPNAAENDQTLGAMLAIIRANNPLGDFGIYRGVVEIAPGWEAFEPTEAAQPTLGTAGEPSLSPTVILTIHIPAAAPSADIARAIEAIMAAHPWEVPVVELGEVQLVARNFTIP